jgi:hypothetical protein
MGSAVLGQREFGKSYFTWKKKPKKVDFQKSGKECMGNIGKLENKSTN